MRRRLLDAVVAQVGSITPVGKVGQAGQVETGRGPGGDDAEIKTKPTNEEMRVRVLTGGAGGAGGAAALAGRRRRPTETSTRAR